MSERKNNPELVRQNILNAVEKLLLTQGIAEISVQKVADMAGVSKGGLFHHFAHKEALLSAYFDGILSDFYHQIQSHRKNHDDDADAIRAYALATFADLRVNHDTAMILLQFISHRAYQMRWREWCEQQFAHAQQDINLTAWRFAIDGIWLNAAIGTISHDELAAVQQWFERGFQAA